MRILKTAAFTFIALFLLAGDPEIAIRGTYVNRDYGYSVRLKNGLIGYNLAPPAPQHGFGVNLGRNSDDYLLVNADYDALFFRSLRRAADYESQEDSKRLGVSVIEDKPSALSGLPARDVILTNPSGQGRVNYLRFRIAYRALPGEVGIIYLIELEQRTRSASGESIFSSVVDSFRLRAAD